MKAVLHIMVFEEMGNLLNTREAAIRFVQIIKDNPCNNVELDFTDVEFMSRSFADQFIKEQFQIQKEFNISIQIINANEEIIKILSIVSRTQDKKDREFFSIPVYKFSNSKLLSDYLFTI
jgi:hypothetical protein